MKALFLFFFNKKSSVLKWKTFQHLKYGQALHFEIEGSEERAMLKEKKKSLWDVTAVFWAEKATNTNPQGQAGNNAIWVVHFNIILKTYIYKMNG